MESVLEKISRKAEFSVTADEVFKVVPSVSRKLAWIIEREGDLDGVRLSDDYIAQLIAEEVRAERVMAEIKRSVPAKSQGTPQTSIFVLTDNSVNVKEANIYVRNMPEFGMRSRMP